MIRVAVFMALGRQGAARPGKVGRQRGGIPDRLEEVRQTWEAGHGGQGDRLVLRGNHPPEVLRRDVGQLAHLLGRQGDQFTADFIQPREGRARLTQKSHHGQRLCKPNAPVVRVGLGHHLPEEAQEMEQLGGFFRGGIGRIHGRAVVDGGGADPGSVSVFFTIANLFFHQWQTIPPLEARHPDPWGGRFGRLVWRSPVRGTSGRSDSWHW